MLRKTFKYRIYPSRKQTTFLNQTLSGCQKLYNMFLAERKNSWEQKQENVSMYQQMHRLLELKKENFFLQNIHSRVLQDVAIRIDLAFQAFFRRCKQKKNPGYPRFKSWFRYDSFTYTQSGFKIIEEDNIVRLSKIGKVKIRYHRSIQGIIKSCTVKKTSTGKWFVSFSCIVPELESFSKTGKITGIDVGLEYFATLSDGMQIENPRFFRKEEKALVKVQRKLSAQKKGSFERNKARQVVARVHERISNKRHNFAHQISRDLVNKFDMIVVEDLSINNMVKNGYRSINKSIGDVAWSMLIDCISYKAEEAGRKFIKVNPAYTSQTCSECGHREKKILSDRMHECSCCDFSLNRDHNAAINILTLGIQSLASA